MISRSQFPLIPAFAVTVHRVQGATLEGDVHVLLNSEFFADGQAVRCHVTHAALS